MDLDAINARAGADSEVQAALILRAEAAAAGDLLHLLLAVPEKVRFRSDGAAIAGAALQLKLDPVVPRRDLVFVDQ